MTNDYDQNNQSVGGMGQEQSTEASGYSCNTAAEDAAQKSNLRFGPAGESVPYQAPQTPRTPQTPTADTTYRYYYGASAERSSGEGSAYQSQSADSRNPYTGRAYDPYTGQPTSGYTQPETAYTPQPESAYRPQPGTSYAAAAVKNKKKKSNVGAIVAAALIFLILGLGIGGGVMWLLGNNQEAEGTVASEAPSSEVEQSKMEIGGEVNTETESNVEENNVFNSTTIEITTNSESTSMTPQSVYEHYVNAVVAIANEGTTTNIFGQVSATASTGSGMIISKDGYILTNNHVVEDAQKLTVTMTNGEEYEATIIGTDSDNDVALIKIEGEDFPTVSIGDSDTIQVGEQLCAIGNPLGELTNTLTVGYVSALDREINENGIPINMFQTDCAINSGNSGGPIFDMNGNVVGITTAKYSTSVLTGSASIEGIGFCIPINDAMDIVNDLLQYGYVRGRVSMGIMCQAISTTVTQYYNLPSGIYVSSVSADSAAEKAGIVQGDIICAVDGVEITSVTALKVKLKEYSPGDTAMLTVYRGESGITEEIEITFDEMVATTNSTEEASEETQEESQMPEESQQGNQPEQGQQVNPFFPFG